MQQSQSVQTQHKAFIHTLQARLLAIILVLTFNPADIGRIYFLPA